MADHILLFVSLALACSVAFAFEPSPIQDFCIADPTSSARINGMVCKDPKMAQAEDFIFNGLHLSGNNLASKVTPANVVQIPGLNTLGISVARIDYAPWGINPPHTHPRASEILTVLDGTLFVGFITSNPPPRTDLSVRYCTREIDVFVFPMGLIHFQRNVGDGSAVALAALSSQNPGVITIANAVFGSNPPIASEVLAKAFQLDKNIIGRLQAQF